MSEPLVPSDRTRLHRKPQRGSFDRAVVDAIPDEAIVCHLGFATERGPIVLPTTCVRLGDQLHVHGSAASHMLRALGGGIAMSCAVTLLDGLVLAKTAFHHSVNYRSVVLFGIARVVEDPAEKRAVLAALIDKLVPGRSRACRPPDDRELGLTSVLALPITEASAKIRSGPPLVEEGADLALPHWAGVIPLTVVRGEPIEATMP